MSDTEDERIFEIETSKNGRAACKKCKQKCLQGELRMAKIANNPFAGGKMKNWHHLDCIFDMFKKQRATTKRIECEDDIIGFDLLSSDDQNMIKEKIKEIRKFFGVSDKSPPKKPKQTNAKPPKASDSNTTTSSPTEDNLFKTFQTIIDKVADHPSYLDKTKIIKTFFDSGSAGHGFNGDIGIWCRLLLPGSVKRIYNVQSKQLVKLFSKICNEDQEEMLEHLEQGDISDTISHFYKQSRKHKSLPTESTITVQKIDAFLEHLSKLTKEDDQIDHFKKILKTLTPEDLRTIIRLIKHDLRMGAGAKHILEGIHPDAYNVYKASKDIDGVVERCFGSKKGQTAEIKILTPVFPMLAEACKSIEYAMKKCPNGMFAEIKYDGERVQVHKYGSEFKYFSRSLKPVTPHKVAHFKDYIPKAFPYAKDLILDTEILMMDTNTGKPMPFGTLGSHKKAQFQDATVCLFVFDCIYYNGESLIKKPLKERKKILNENMIEVPNHIVFSEMKEINEPKKLANMIAKVLKLGLEGLVLKDLMSNYEPGKRHWLKVKKDYLFGGAMADSADLIVLGAWYGTGQMGGMMSVFLMGCYDPKTKRFCTVTKVHTGKTLTKNQEQQNQPPIISNEIVINPKNETRQLQILKPFSNIVVKPGKERFSVTSTLTSPIIALVDLPYDTKIIECEEMSKVCETLVQSSTMQEEHFSLLPISVESSNNVPSVITDDLGFDKSIIECVEMSKVCETLVQSSTMQEEHFSLLPISVESSNKVPSVITDDLGFDNSIIECVEMSKVCETLVQSSTMQEEHFSLLPISVESSNNVPSVITDDLGFGHDDKTLNRLQKELKMVKISGDPDKVPNWLHCTRTMVPDLVAEDPKKQPVWEVTGAEFSQQHDVHTANGISIRFPRVTKIRDDKTWETATNVEELKVLFKKSKEDTDVSLLLKNYKGDNDASSSKTTDSDTSTPKKRKVSLDPDSSTSSSHDSSVVNDSSKKKRKLDNSEDKVDSGNDSPKKLAKKDEPSTSKDSGSNGANAKVDKKLKRSDSKESKKGKRVEIENPLPAVFDDIKALFVTSEDAEIERYFVAFGGTILKPDKSKNATHIVHFNKKVNDIPADWSKEARHVHVSWIVDSANKMELQDEKMYVVRWEPKNGGEDATCFEEMCKQ